MKRYICLFIAAAMVGALTTACIKDHIEPLHGGIAEGEPVSIVLSTFTMGDAADNAATRGTVSGTDDERDSQFSSLRVMIFHTGSVLAYNKVVDLQQDGNPFTIAMTTGTYDFVFVANEDSDTALTARLNAYTATSGKTIGSIYGESFSSAVFRNDYTIPMTKVLKNVRVTANDLGVGTVIEGSQTYTSPASWPVKLERAAIRIDLILKTDNAMAATNFSALQLTNVPDKVFLFDTDGSTINYNVTGAGSFETTSPLAAYRSIAGTDGDVYASYTPAGSDDPGIDYTLTETSASLGFVKAADNNYYWYKRIILPSSMFTPASKEANAVKLTAVANGRPLSATLGKSGVFTAPRNQRYTLRGTLVPDMPISFTVEVTPWGQERSVSLPFKIPEIPDAGTALSDNTYVGAFWRATEKGERVIRIPVSVEGTWAVQVYEYGEGFSRGDILFSKGDTGSDAVLYGAGTDPGAETYPVTGDISEIGDTYKDGTQNYIKFRIGLKDCYSATKTAPARYAVAVVAYTPTNGTTIYQKLFLRQGEGADYLMRPQDGSDNGIISLRPQAVPFSPYNLTHPDFRAGGTAQSYPATAQPSTNIDNYFTEYPTQAGALYQWAPTHGLYAFSPVSPLDKPSGWAASANSDYWDNLNDAYETCPYGYRRPTDGLPNNDAVSPIAADSELHQSLLSRPFNGTGSVSGDLLNAVWGYYADGFFDRRALDAQPYYANTTGYANTAVDVNEPTVAYIGNLFYNVATNASIFFPTPGFRDLNSGNLTMSGNQGNYWSSSSQSSSGALFLNFNNDININKVNRSTSSRYVSYSIRCVKKEKWTPGGGTLTAELVASAGATPSTEGGSVMGNGTTYTISVTSDTEWTAEIHRTTDAVTSGETSTFGKPLLVPTTGFDGGLTTATISKTGDDTFTFTPADYISLDALASGTFEIVFRNAATGYVMHTMAITVTQPLAMRFARSNIVMYTPDGGATKVLTFAETIADHTTAKNAGGVSVPAIPANVQGLHFRWGSLVGVTSDGTDGTVFDNTVNTTTSHVVFWPTEYTEPTGTWIYNADDTGVVADVDVQVPYVTGSEPGAGTNSDLTVNAFDDYPNGMGKGFDKTTAKGDICRYITAQKWVDGNWRMPTAAEIKAFVDETKNNLALPGNNGNGKIIGTWQYSINETISGTGGGDAYGYCKMGNVRIMGSGAIDNVTLDVGNNVENLGPWIIVLPAAGNRNNTSGVMRNIGNCGNYWSATPGNSIYAYDLSYGFSGVNSTHDYDRTYGYSVRCIRE